MASSDAILARLLHLHPKKIDLTLGRVRELLFRLGSPHENLPPVVHVAGTNGKGSSIAFLRAMLETAGYRVHVYTSPHLVRFTVALGLAIGHGLLQPLADHVGLAVIHEVGLLDGDQTRLTRKAGEGGLADHLLAVETSQDGPGLRLHT